MRQKTAAGSLVAVAVLVLLFAGSVAAQCSGGAGPQSGLAAVSCTGVPSWNPTGSYVDGSLVTYNGCLYRANQSFASNPGWCPGCTGVFIYGNGSACPAAGCNYGAQGPCSGGGATPTAVPTATSTAVPTVTPMWSATSSVGHHRQPRAVACAERGFQPLTGAPTDLLAFGFAWAGDVEHAHVVRTRP